MFVNASDFSGRRAPERDPEAHQAAMFGRPADPVTEVGDNPAGWAGEDAADADSLIEAFLPGHWFLEFRQDYGDGVSVTKRGLDASPMVVRKYKVGPDEVVAFSNADGNSRAFTAFHFHPDFPEDRRRHYMEVHREGYELARDMLTHLADQRERRRAALRGRFGRMRRAVSLAVHTAILFVLTHYSSGR